MSMFEVPGWNVPGAPVAQDSKKRKRPHAAKETDDVDDAQRMRSAQKNIEKLMQSLGSKFDALDGEEGFPPSKKKKKHESKDKGMSEKSEKGKMTKGKGDKREAKEESHDPASKKGGKEDMKKSEKESKGESRKNKGKDSKPEAEGSHNKLQPASQTKKQKKQKRAPSTDARPDAELAHEREDPPNVAMHSPVSASTPSAEKSKGKGKEVTPAGLTALQANMKKSLDGARFRWINETLYKSDSASAHELMSKDPAIFADYHTGFRHQVESWPTNPVAHYIAALAAYPPKTVIADLGCGDAALARALVPQGFVVLSFDLVADGAFVVEADTCARVPLPGSEESGSGEDGEGGAQIVDVVVCALSLMGTNWPGCIREAWRVLRMGGELKIAEVTSRFTGVDEFVAFVTAFGFRLKSKDERNTHFTLFEFTKVARKAKSEKDWKKLMARGSLLKPCEYKRR